MGVRAPQGHARVRTATGGDVMHRQNAGYPVPTVSKSCQIMLEAQIASTANLKVHSHGQPSCKKFALTL